MNHTNKMCLRNTGGIVVARNRSKVRFVRGPPTNNLSVNGFIVFFEDKIIQVYRLKDGQTKTFLSSTTKVRLNSCIHIDKKNNFLYFIGRQDNPQANESGLRLFRLEVDASLTKSDRLGLVEISGLVLEGPSDFCFYQDNLSTFTFKPRWQIFLQ